MVDSPPLVSVLICLYNSRPYINETLRCVFAQTLEDFEVIVVDDGSTDGCAEHVEREYPDSRVTVVRQSNGGQGLALRTAIAHARGEWLAFLDHDDVWVPEKLERQLAMAAADPAAGLVFSDCVLIDAEGRELRHVSDQFDFSTIDLAGTRGYAELLRRGCFISMPTVLARTAAVRAVGDVNPAYRYVMDYDLWLRLARVYPMRYVPEPLAKWRVHDSQFTHRHPEVALAEETDLLRPIMRNASCSREVRIAIGDNLFGRHRDCFRLLLKQRRFGLALRTALGIMRYPDRVADYGRHTVSRTALGPLLETSIDRWLRGRNAVACASAYLRDAVARASAYLRDAVARAAASVQLFVLRVRRAPGRFRRMLCGTGR